MKVFISYSHQDKKVADLIVKELEAAGHTVWYDRYNLRPGQNIFEAVRKGISDSEAVLFILSNHSINSKNVMNEIKSVIFKDISKQEKRVIPFVIDNVPIPEYFLDYLYVDARDSIDRAIKEVSDDLNRINRDNDIINKKQLSQQSESQLSLQTRIMRSALQNGHLTLICGAGISVGAGIPDWNSLLKRLLTLMLKNVSENYSLSVLSVKPDEFQNRYAPSSLVMGKYLKTNLGKDFLPELRTALYEQAPKSGKIIESIASLSRPQRNGKPLDSIITFNFDALLEENFDLKEIKYKSVYSEGHRASSNEIPIYHVHGYLPRSGKIPGDVDIVFSEDAYHGQFIDPFSWSNLILLNKLSQNTCLLIGISLSDPNMRRLLDVSNRKNPEKTKNHFLIKRRPKSKKTSDKMDDLAIFLEEQDANGLGINMIWVDEFDEVATVLERISKND